MDRNTINTSIISYLKPFGAERIGIFGSFAREEENPGSDIDILVKFRETITLLQLVKIERELSHILGKKVDLVTEAAIRNEKLRSYIYQDLKIIFE